jgi:hypothetical protein
MTNPLRTGGALVPTTVTARPPMPSITASVLEESLRLVARTRRALACVLARG